MAATIEGNNRSIFAQTFHQKMKSQEEAPSGGGYRYKSAHSLLRSVWVQSMINSHTHMVLYGPCLKVFHPVGLVFSSKVKDRYRGPWHHFHGESRAAHLMPF